MTRFLYGEDRANLTSCEELTNEPASKRVTIQCNRTHPKLISLQPFDQMDPTSIILFNNKRYITLNIEPNENQ